MQQDARYLPPFCNILEWLGSQRPAGSESLTLRLDDLQDVLRHVLAAVPLDQDAYFAAHPGIAQEVERGHYASAAHHFVLHGYFEGRTHHASQDDSDRPALPSYKSLKSRLKVRPYQGTLYADLSFSEFCDLLRMIVGAIPVDESWYCARYPDVAEAIRKGAVASAAEHFVATGYFASRWPFPFDLDEAWYLSRYPDVRQEMTEVVGETPKEHFIRQGYGQGRFPSRSWACLQWDKPFDRKAC